MTDHLRHPYLARIALAKGLDVYTQELRDSREGVAYPQAIDEWLDVPYVYPPGALVFWLPVSLVGLEEGLSRCAFGAISIVYLLFFAHLSLWALWRALEAQPPGLRALVGALGWLVLLHLALQGQFDVAWVGCGSMALWRISRGEPASALRWICGAALLNFRAATLAPAGAYALVEAIRGRRPRTWPWPTLVLLAVTGALVLGTFFAIFGGTRPDLPRLVDDPAQPRMWLLAAVTAVALVAALRWANGYVAAGVAFVGAIAVWDVPHFWHAVFMLPIVAGVGAVGAAKRPALARLALVAWFAAMQALAWRTHPLFLFRDVARYLRTPPAGSGAAEPPRDPGRAANVR